MGFLGQSDKESAGLASAVRCRMKTLYVSDLDGTLLRSDERTSEYTSGLKSILKGKHYDSPSHISGI